MSLRSPSHWIQYVLGEFKNMKATHPHDVWFDPRANMTLTTKFCQPEYKLTLMSRTYLAKKRSTLFMLFPY